MFSPNEVFDPIEFVQRLSARYRDDRVDHMLRDSAQDIRKSPHPIQRFVDYFDLYLWPKQRPAAMAWLMRTYRTPDV